MDTSFQLSLSRSLQGQTLTTAAAIRPKRAAKDAELRRQVRIVVLSRFGTVTAYRQLVQDCFHNISAVYKSKNQHLQDLRCVKILKYCHY